jgi:26S proteasome regulatory subunit N6
LEILDNITKEVRKADDKHMLLEIYLTESKLNFGLENISKAKASLTAARACANSIYCPPNLQAEIDLMGGILHAEEKDYTTAYYIYNTYITTGTRTSMKHLRLSIHWRIGNVH